MWFISEMLKLKKSARTIRLTAEEKASLEKNILAFMKANPVQTVRIEKEGRHIPHAQGQTFLFSFLTRKNMFATIAVVLVVVLGGGVSYAAEGTTPGHPLYPLKHFNEEVKAALVVSPEADATWDARRVERRLEEATTLASEGKLDASAQVSLAQSLKNQVKETEKDIQRLELKGKSEEAQALNLRLIGALKLHQDLLSSFNATSSAKTDEDHDRSESNQNNLKLLTEVKLRALEADKIKVELNSKFNAETQSENAAAGKIISAHNKINEVKNFLSQKESDVSTETKAKAQAQVLAAEKLILEAEAKLKTQSWNEAFRLASEAHETAESAKAIVSVQVHVKVNVGKILNVTPLLEDSKKIEIKLDDDSDKDEKRDSHDTAPEIKAELNIQNHGEVKLF